MFERFTERARQVVVLAQEEARTLKHNYIGTEHILLGLLREEEGLAARVLESLDITVERVRAQVVRIVGSGEEVTSGQIPFTPRAKKVLELALREALSLGHNYIGTEHILLGLVRENEGVAARILRQLDADAEKIRNEVIQRLPEEARQSSSGFVESRPVAPDPPAPRRFRQQSEEEPQRDRIVLRIELGITPPSAGVEQLNKAAIDAVQRVYERGGAELHFAGIRLIDKNVTIAQVGAFVGLGESVQRLPGAGGADVAERVVGQDDSDRLHVSARLFAETDAGERLNVARSSMGAGLGRRGVSAIWKRYSGPPLPEDPEAQERVLESYRVQRQDVKDAINQLLGRDPEQHRPPRLSWEPLIELLDREGITVTEDQLLATPFVFEFSDELLAELSP